MKKIIISIISVLSLNGTVYAETLTLGQALEIALKHNYSISAAVYNAESAKFMQAAADAEFDLKVMPSIIASTSYFSTAAVTLSKKLTTGTVISASPGITNVSDSINPTMYAAIDQPLLRGLGSEAALDTLHSAMYATDTARRALHKKNVEIALDTIKTVYRIKQLTETINLYRALKGRLENNAKISRLKEKVSLATPMDVYRANIRIKDTEATIAESNEALTGTLDRLKILLAMPLQKDLLVDTSLDVLPFTLTRIELLDIAQRNNLDLKQANSDINEAQRKTEVAKNNLLPKVDVILDYQKYGSTQAVFGSGAFNDQRFGISIVGSTDFSMANERAALAVSQLRARMAEDAMRLRGEEMKQSIFAQEAVLRKADELIRIKTEQITQAQGKLALAKVKFDNGLADNFDLIEAESELHMASLALLNAKVQYIIATYDMRALIGTLIEFRDN